MGLGFFKISPFYFIITIQYISLSIKQMQKYQILSVIGEGAYGVVLKCKDIENNTFMAIKKFKDSDDEELAKKTAMREVKILKMLSHPNIILMKQAFRKKGIVYLVFQYIDNNLLQLLQKSPNGLSPRVLRKLAYQILKGLAYLHSLDIVHRDIKPENLLVSSIGHDLKICDFGFARLTRKEKGELQMTDYVATRWYRSPELLVGGEYGKEVDLWAVGCIMCELVDGNPLFPGENQLDQLFLIQKCLGPLPPILYERFIKNQRFIGMKFPQIQNLDQIDKKYLGKMDPKGLSLIKSLLKMLPSQRMTAQQALNHPYFAPEKPQQIQTQPKNRSPNSRKQIFSSIAYRKREDQDSSNLQRLTKYGKIYNRRKTTNYNQLAIIYQSSNQQQYHYNYTHQLKIGRGQVKSLGKGDIRPTQHQDNHADDQCGNLQYQNQEQENEEIHNVENMRIVGKDDGMFRTQGRSFYTGKSECSTHVQGKKNIGIVNQNGNNQLPFLIGNSNLYKTGQIQLQAGPVNRKMFNSQQKKHLSIGPFPGQNLKK